MMPQPIDLVFEFDLVPGSVFRYMRITTVHNVCGLAKPCPDPAAAALTGLCGKPGTGLLGFETRIFHLYELNYRTPI